MSNTRDRLGEQQTLDALVSDTLEELEEDGIRTVPTEAFYKRNHLKKVVLPSATTLLLNAFSRCSQLERVDLTTRQKVSLDKAFDFCTNLKALCIYSSELPSFYTRYLANTQIAKGNGAVYVPSDMVDVYRHDPRWSHFFIWDAADIMPPSFDTISDDWETIIQYAEAHSILDHYNIGDIKSFQVGTTTYHMRLIKADGDVLSDAPDQKAGSTWLSMQSLYTGPMNESKTSIRISSEFPWAQDQTDPSMWQSTLKGQANCISMFIWRVSAAAKVTLSIAYYAPCVSYLNRLTIVTDREMICLQKNGMMDWETAEITLEAGEEILVGARYIKRDSSTTDLNKECGIRFSWNGELSLVPAQPDDVLYYGGTIGGWKYSDMAMNTLPGLFDTLPEILKMKIKKVEKTYWDMEAGVMKSTGLRLWTPSAWEMGFAGYESEGVQYTEMFKNENDRITFSMSNGDCKMTCLRSTYSDSRFCTVDAYGKLAYQDANASTDYLLGFCL